VRPRVNAVAEYVMIVVFMLHAVMKHFRPFVNEKLEESPPCSLLLLASRRHRRI